MAESTLTPPSKLASTPDMITVDFSTSLKVPQAVLRPITPSQNPRYTRQYSVSRAHLPEIQPGWFSSLQFPAPPYSLASWVQHIGPEGASYWVNATANIVTDSVLDQTWAYDALARGISEFQGRRKSMPSFPPQSELFIQVQEDKVQCSYYVADHDTQAIFWSEAVHPYELDLPAVTSTNQMKHMLQAMFWEHVEYFPHRPISKSLREELVAILRHAQLDQMTSLNSTFPYGAEDCEKFINLLSHQDGASSYSISSIARVWSVVCRHRFDIFYGDEHARLGRDQRVVEHQEARRPRWQTPVSALHFGLPESVNAELEELFVDDLVYSIHWRKVMKGMAEGWRESRQLAISLLIVNALFLIYNPGQRFLSGYFGLTGALFAICALISSFALLHQNASRLEATANSACEHMCDIQHPTLGFYPTAVAYSVPRALVIWSAIFTTLEVLYTIIESLPN